MKKHGSSKSDSQKSIIFPPPAYPFSGPQLFGDLKNRLSRLHERPLSFSDLARFTGKSISTAHHWFTTYEHPNLIAVMTLLERMPKAMRHDYIDSHCRIFPSVDASWLAHNPNQVAGLEKVIQQERGVTFVTGCSEWARTLFVSALGHAAPKHIGVTGMDIHRPDKFVPVPNVYYIDPVGKGDCIAQLVFDRLPQILTSDAKLLIFNGPWSIVPKCRSALLRSTEHRHVVIAATHAPRGFELEQAGRPVTILSLSRTKAVPNGIQVEWTEPNP